MMTPMERRTAQAEPRPRRRKPPSPRAKGSRAATSAPGADPHDDRFAPHPGESIDTVYVVARAVDLIGARPRQVLGVVLACLVLSAVVILPLLALDVLGAAGLPHAMHPASFTVLLVLGWAAGLLLQTPLVGAAIEVHTTRRGLFLEFLRRGTAQLPDLLVAGLAVLGITVLVLAVCGALVAGVGAIAALLPWEFVTLMVSFAATVALLLVALRVITAFALVIPVLVVEQLPPGPALRRSWALGWPNGWSILMALLLPAILVQGVLFVAGFLPAIVGVIAGVVLGLALAVYHSVVAPVAYVAIREYVDGIDPARLPARR